MKWFDLWFSRSWRGHIFCNVHIKMTTKIKPYGKDFIFIMFIKYCPHDNCTDFKLQLMLLLILSFIVDIQYPSIHPLIYGTSDHFKFLRKRQNFGQNSKNVVIDPDLKSATKRDLLIMCCLCDWPGPGLDR